MVETVKQAEDSDDLIVRLYETAGTHVNTKISIDMNLSEAWLADLMEAPTDKLHEEDGAFQLSFTPFEITTIRLARRQN